MPEWIIDLFLFAVCDPIKLSVARNPERLPTRRQGAGSAPFQFQAMILSLADVVPPAEFRNGESRPSGGRRVLAERLGDRFPDLLFDDGLKLDAQFA